MAQPDRRKPPSAAEDFDGIRARLAEIRKSEQRAPLDPFAEAVAEAVTETVKPTYGYGMFLLLHNGSPA